MKLVHICYYSKGNKDFEGAELAEMKIVPSYLMITTGYKEGVITGIETINGKDTYAIKDGKTTFYYDVNLV
jgi:hypothetical protein